MPGLYEHRLPRTDGDSGGDGRHRGDRAQHRHTRPIFGDPARRRRARNVHDASRRPAQGSRRSYQYRGDLEGRDMSEQSKTDTDWGRHLVDALISTGVILARDGKQALEDAARRDQSVITTLTDAGFVSTTSCLHALSALSGLPIADLASDPPEEKALALLPVGVARRYRAIVYRLGDGGEAQLVVGEPLNAYQIRKITELIGHEVSMCLLADPMVIERITANLEQSAAATSTGAQAGEPSDDGRRAKTISAVRLERNGSSSHRDEDGGPADRSRAPVATEMTAPS